MSVSLRKYRKWMNLRADRGDHENARMNFCFKKGGRGGKWNSAEKWTNALLSK